MPNRILRDWTDSEPVNSLSDAAEKFFTRLIMKADDFGRYYGDPQMLRPMLYPRQLDAVREVNLERLISECEKARLVRLYEADGKKVIEILKFRQQKRAEKSRFPDPCLADDAHLTSSGEADAHLGVVGGGDEGGGGMPAHAFPEIPTESEAITQTMNAGIPPDFVSHVYQDWSTRAGKDGAGNVVKWLPYVKKRWTREQNEWRAGTHRGAKPKSKIRTDIAV